MYFRTLDLLTPKTSHSSARAASLLLAIFAATSPWASARSNAWNGDRRPTSETGLPVVSRAPASEGESLASVFKLALTRAESIAIQDELLNQATELEKQAKGSLLPTVSGSAVFLRQEEPGNTVGGSISPSAQNTIKVTADQPLFRGFRDFAALRQRSDQVNVQKYARQDAVRQLFYNTATAYYNVLALQSDVQNYRNEIEIHRKRLSDLEGFVRIGRSQITDVLTQKATISSLEATAESTIGELESAREVLAFFSGLDRNAALQDTEAPPAAPDPVQSYLARVEERTDVKTANASSQAAEENVPIARGQHWPSVDLLGDYYFTRPGQALKDVSWDVSLAITLPIFAGGTVLSQTRQAASVARQSALQLSQTRRQAEQEIRQFYDSFAADQRQIAKISETSELARKNYEAEIREFKNGLVTNLDVLTSITTWQDSLRLLAHQQFKAKMDYVKLQAAAAARPELQNESL